MTRTFDGLFPQLASFQNLHLAYCKASRGKRGQPAVAAFEYCAGSQAPSSKPLT